MAGKKQTPPKIYLGLNLLLQFKIILAMTPIITETLVEIQPKIVDSYPYLCRHIFGVPISLQLKRLDFIQ